MHRMWEKKDAFDDLDVSAGPVPVPLADIPAAEPGADASASADVAAAGAAAAPGSDAAEEAKREQQIALIKSVEDPNLERSDHYRRMMGRWRKKACEVWQNPLFFLVAEVSQRSGKPIEHFRAFLRQTPEQFDEALPDLGGHYARIVYYKADEIMSEYSDLLCRNTAWASADFARARSIDPEGDLANEVLSLGIELSGNQASNFKRRILDSSRRFRNNTPWAHGPMASWIIPSEPISRSSVTTMRPTDKR